MHDRKSGLTQHECLAAAWGEGGGARLADGWRGGGGAEPAGGGGTMNIPEQVSAPYITSFLILQSVKSLQARIP